MVKFDEYKRETHHEIEELKNRALKNEGKAKILEDEVQILRNKNKNLVVYKEQELNEVSKVKEFYEN